MRRDPLFDELRAPAEEAAEERAWEIVRSAYAEREPVARRRSKRSRLVPGGAVVTIATVLALSPAGAAVHKWIDRTLSVPQVHRALISLPAPGRLLVSGGTGAWTMSADGVKRRLGPWPQASWSPRGLYVLLAAGDQLVAADPHGTTRWSVSRPSVRFPRWYAPTGYRVAYLSGRTLRVIAGDSSGDVELAPRVALVAPSWRAGHPYQLAYATDRGSVVVEDTDARLVLWSRRVAGARLVSWSASGSRLLVVAGREALVFNAAGKRIGSVSAAGPIVDAAVSPDGSTVALLSGGSVTLTQIGLRGSGGATRRVFGGERLAQLLFSPNGQWLLVTYPPADQWVFIHVTGRPRDSIYSRIAEQFGGAEPFFPHVDGWCCTAVGSAG